jgi:beta-galactosidase
VDLAGIPKDRYYLYQSYWAPERNTVHILPHWNWPERVGKNTPVYVYTGGDSAELFLNGKSMGMRVKNPNAEVVRDRYALRWLDIPYAPGKLEAVAYRQGQIIGRAVVKTAGEPAKVRVTPDRKKLEASGEDLSYLLVEAVDQDGNLCPLAMNNVKFAVAGPAKIAGVANGDHFFPEEFVADHVPLFYGKAVVVIRADEGKGGSIDVTATSWGLRKARVSLKSAPKH